VNAPPSSSGPDDDALGRLLAEGLGRVASDPVDDGRLLAGARRGAERIHRRRRTGLVLATVAVLGTPVGLVASELMPREQVTSATSSVVSESASAVPAAPSAAGSEVAAGDAKATTAESSADAGVSPDALRGPARTASLAPGNDAAGSAQPVPSSLGVAKVSPGGASSVVVPDAALVASADLTAAGLTGVTLRSVSDTTYSGPVPAVPAADACGTARAAGQPEALGRTAVLGSGPASSASSWLLTGTVRVFAGAGAPSYVSAASRLGCVSGVAVPGGGSGVVGRGAADASGRTHWYGAARVGRVVTEIRLVVPRSAAVEEGDVARLLRTAAGRVTSSGLAAAADTDPSLG